MKTSKVLLIMGIMLVSLPFQVQATALNDQDQSQGQAQGQAQGQLQGQLQGQAQGQAQVGINKNANSNSNSNANSNSNSVKSTNLNGQAQSTENANNASQAVNVGGDVYKAPDIPVSTAYAPNMSPSAQCMGVASGGVQGMSIGISLGKSYESTPCNQRELARIFFQMGEKTAALDVLCSMDGAGVVGICKKPVPAPVAISPAPAQTESVKAVKTEDPAVVIPASNQPVVSSNGYYSVVTNPLYK